MMEVLDLAVFRLQ